MIAQAALVKDGRFVRVIWLDGEIREVSARWLFDHADDAAHEMTDADRLGG